MKKKIPADHRCTRFKKAGSMTMQKAEISKTADGVTSRREIQNLAFEYWACLECGKVETREVEVKESL